MIFLIVALILSVSFNLAIILGRAASPTEIEMKSTIECQALRIQELEEKLRDRLEKPGTLKAVVI